MEGAQEDLFMSGKRYRLTWASSLYVSYDQLEMQALISSTHLFCTESKLILYSVKTYVYSIYPAMLNILLLWNRLAKLTETW
jgi:hypothetical protein